MSKEFDPDKFLEEFNPDEFLSEMDQDYEEEALPPQEPDASMAEQALAKLSKPLAGLEPFVSGASRALLPEFISDPGMSAEEKKALEGFKLQEAPKSATDEYYKGQQDLRRADEAFNKENPTTGLAIDVVGPMLSLPVGKVAGMGASAVKGKSALEAAKAVGTGAGAGALYGAGYSEAEPFREGKDFGEESQKLMTDMALPAAIGGGIPAAGQAIKKGVEFTGKKVQSVQDLLDIFEQGKKGKDIIGKDALTKRTKESEELAEKIVGTLKDKYKQSSKEIGDTLKSINDKKIPLDDGLVEIQTKLNGLKQGATQETLDIINAVEGQLDKFKFSKEKLEVADALKQYKDLVTKEQQKASVVGEKTSGLQPKVNLATRTVTGGLRKLNSALEDVVSPLQVPIKSTEIKRFAKEASPEDLYAVKRNLDELYDQAVRKGASPKSVQETKNVIMDMIEKELKNRDPKLLDNFQKARQEMTNLNLIKETKSFPVGKAMDAQQLDPAKYLQTPYQDAISDLGDKLKTSLSGKSKKEADLQRFLSDYEKVTGKQVTDEVMDLAQREYLGGFGATSATDNPLIRFMGSIGQGAALGAESIGKQMGKSPALQAKTGLSISSLLNNLNQQNDPLMTPMDQEQDLMTPMDQQSPIEEPQMSEELQSRPLAPNEELRYTKDGVGAIYDTNTRQFLRFADE
jgi:hypothetical protein